MSDDSTTQCLLFPGIFRKPLVARFDQREGCSDGGAVLLKAADRHYGLLEELTASLRDQRQAGKVDHTLYELVAHAITAGASRVASGRLCMYAVAIPRQVRWSLFARTVPSTSAARDIRQDGSCVTRFEACTAFTYVTAFMLAKSLKRPSTPKAPTASLSLPPLRLLPGGANQIPGGTFTHG